MGKAITRSRGRRILLGVAAIATAAIALSGCRASAEAASDADKASGEGLVIGWSQRGISGSDWWKTLVEGGQAEADEMGARIELLDANGDTVRQNADIQTLITKGVDVVIMNANDPKAQRQIPNWANTPPTAGPTMTLTPHIADTSADARVHNQFGSAALITAYPKPASIPPAAPCTVRATSSSSMVGASAHPSVPAPNTERMSR